MAVQIIQPMSLHYAQIVIGVFMLVRMAKHTMII
jgi:hypothetical protein